MRSSLLGLLSNMAVLQTCADKRAATNSEVRPQAMLRSAPTPVRQHCFDHYARDSSKPDAKE